MMWSIAEVAEGTWVVIEEDGVWIRSDTTDLIQPNELRHLKTNTRLGRLLPTLVVQLNQLGVAHPRDGDIFISFEDFADFEDSDIDAFDDLLPWSPFAIEIETTGTLGRPDFRYQIRVYWGRQQVYIEQMGCFVKRGQTVYRLEKQTYGLLKAIREFNALSADEKEKPDVLIRFAQIKGVAEDVGAQIDRYILDQRVIVPARINLDFIEESDGRITFVPRIDRVPDKEFLQVYLASNDIEDIYSVTDSEGGRIRVILDETQKEVLRRMRKVRHLGGVDRASVLRNPYEVFDGVASAVDIDLAQFGPRVKGIGDFPFISQPFIKYADTGIFEDNPGASASERKRFDAGLDCKYLDGAVEKIHFESSRDLLDFYHKTKVAWEDGKNTVDFKGKTIVVDRNFFEGMQTIVDRITKPKKACEKQASEHSYLLIYTNEEQLEYREDEEARKFSEDRFSLPLSLLDESLLKGHQREGLKWLQLNYFLNRKSGRRGCFLADEMGLGKTLQVLTFLAWLVERGEISPQSMDPMKAPWNPILIVAPVMLLENESWQKDMRKFFRHEGAIFEPYVVLHGAQLKKMRRSGMSGRETDLKESVLDLDRLRQFRVILTSYETVVNYQFSFAMMKDSWSVVVTDEAQEYKTPNTKISHALKSLSPKIRIACTGTPVETKLMDVWNIFDFLQPGILGSASEFVKRYERPIFEDPSQRDRVLSDLKNRLHFGKNYSYLLRREKETTLEGLPAKHDHKIYCNLSPDQREKHVDFVNQVKMKTNNAHPLAVLQQLMKLYQHPDLLPTYSGLKPDDVQKALNRGPKLKAILQVLADIRARGEKVLIFTRSLHMQQLLSTVVSSQFGLSVDIINGMVPRSGGTKSGARTRKEGISRFCESEGFNVLIVSPDVAGVGLTIIEANHVIHYGRWWNPAKEMQATDRVYRIGQEKDVHVYYPIARDPEGAFKTFDEKLDNLLEKRRALARDFLAPMPDEDENGIELIQDLLGGGGISQTGAAAKGFSEQEIASLPWDRFEAFVALLEQKAGQKVILTPKSADYGIDILSLQDNKIRLIQCKHSTWGSSFDADAIAEVINAFDNYRLHWLRGIAGVLLEAVLVTNGKLTRSALSLARQSDVQTLDCQSLLRSAQKQPCSLAEIEMVENCRHTSMSDVRAAVKNFLA